MARQMRYEGVRMPTQDWNRVGKGKRFKGPIDANTIPIGPIVANYGGE